MFVTSSLRLGGQERQLSYILENIRAKDLIPILVIWSYQNNNLSYFEKIRSLGVKIIKINTNSNPIFKLASLFYVIYKNKPKIVYSYAFYTNILVYIATIFLRVVPIGSIRSNYKTSIKYSGSFIGYLCFRYPRLQISNNYCVVEELSTSPAFWKPKNIYVISNGVDTKLFNFHKFPEKDCIFRIVGIGSLLTVKRWDLLLEVANNLVNDQYKFELDIYGEGPELEKLQAIIYKYNLQAYCRLHKSRDDIQNIIKDSHILVLMSDDEGCPNVIIEAMSVGRPVVATNVGDVSKMVSHAKSGFIVQRGGVELATSRVKQLINDHDLCEEMGSYGHKIAINNYSIDRLISSLCSVFNKLN